MPGPRKESHIADRTVAPMCSAEPILLNVGNALHDESNSPKDNARNITSRPKVGLIEFGNIRRVE